MEFLVNTVRMVDYDQAREYALGNDDSLKEKLAVGILNPEDFKKLNLSSNLNIKLSNKDGHVTVKAIQEKDVPSGIILMPVSIWANQITGLEKNRLLLKNIKVNVDISDESIMDVKDLINSFKN